MRRLVTPARVCGFGLALLFGACYAQTLRAQVVDTLPRVRVIADTLTLGDLYRINDSLAHVEDSLTRRLDSLQHPLRYIQAATDAAYRAAMHPGRWYSVALGAGLAVNYTCPRGFCDRDAGGYRDSWRSYDKVEHFEIAYFLSARAMDMGVQRRWAVALTCGAAIGWEGTQARGHGFASYRDAVASCTGAALPALVGWIKAHREPGASATRSAPVVSLPAHVQP